MVKLKKAVIYAVAFASAYFFGGTVAKQTKRAERVMARPTARLAIIIDDFGYHGDGTDEMLALDIDFTAAVMPFSEHSAEDAKAALSANKEVIIHMPMESLTGKRSWVGDKGVFRNMSDDQIKQTVDEAFSIVEGAEGVNNHMGSAIMEDKRSFCAVARALADRNAFFIDSMTTEKTVSGEVCEQEGVTLLKRDVFLDSTNDEEVVKKNLKKAAEKALKNGSAIAIGHVGPEGGKITARAIKDLAPEIRAMGVEFVKASELAQ